MTPEEYKQLFCSTLLVENYNKHKSFNTHMSLEEFTKEYILPCYRETIYDYLNPTILRSFKGIDGKRLYFRPDFLRYEEFYRSGVTDEREELGDEECHRLFSLNAIEQGLNGRVAPKEKLYKTIQQKQDAIIQSNMERNADFFDDEMDKLDNWADDKRKSLRQALKDLDDQIKVLKRQARTARSLPEKLSLQKKVRAKEQKRDQAWKDYDIEGRKIEAQKDELIQKIESQLDHRINTENLFTIRWTLQ